jgi:outer membrane protein assembly factor BamA
MADAPLRDDVRRLWKTGIVDEVRVEVDGTRIAFVVAQRWQIRRVTVKGGEPAMARRFRWLAGVEYEPMRIMRMADGLVTHYRRDGRLDAHIETVAKRAPGGIDVCVVANLGPKVTVGALSFPGRTSVFEQDLVAALPGTTVNRVGEIYDLDALADLTPLAEVYWNHGYRDVRFQPPRTVRHGNKIELAIPVVEGAQYRIGEIHASHPEALTLHTGDVLSRKAMWEAAYALRDRFAPGEDVFVETIEHPDRHTIDLWIQLPWRWPWPVQ